MELDANELIKVFNAFTKDNELKAKTILTIKSKPSFSVNEEETGLELNDGYDFEVDGAVPEIADAIAKLAIELPKNGFGEDSDTYFITLISQYFEKLKQ
jgi:hypothetical protein